MDKFDIVKYLKENKLGSYGILSQYVDLQPLSEGKYKLGGPSNTAPSTKKYEDMGLTGVTARQITGGKYVVLVNKSEKNEEILNDKKLPYEKWTGD